MHCYSKNKGFGLIEILVAVALFAILVTADATLFVAARKSVGQAAIQNQAVLVLAETREMLEHLWNQDADLLVNGTFYLVHQPEFSTWLIQSPFPDNDLFVREVMIADALRHDGADDLYLGGDGGSSHPDPHTKKITVQILWAPDFIRTNLLNYTLYFSNWDHPYTF